MLLATLQEKYWILYGMSAIRRILSRCILCFRLKPTNPTQLTGLLPATRVTPYRVFAHVGLDCEGPINIELPRNKVGKSYVSRFCMYDHKSCSLGTGFRPVEALALVWIILNNRPLSCN